MSRRHTIMLELGAGDTLGIFSCIINAKYDRTNSHCFTRTFGFVLFFHSTNNVLTRTIHDILY